MIIRRRRKSKIQGITFLIIFYFLRKDNCCLKEITIYIHFKSSTKGLGVSFMENAVDWHGKAPNDAEYDKAMAELRASYEVMEKEAERING